MTIQPNESLVYTKLLTTTGVKKIGIIVLNRPQKINALSLPMTAMIVKTLKAWRSNDEISMLWIEGVGEKGFCAGGDVRQIRHDFLTNNTFDAEQFFTLEYEQDSLLYHYPKPVICWGNGVVMGGGMGILQASSHRITTPSTVMAMPETKIGFYPDVGAAHFLNLCPFPIGLFMGLSALSINATEAQALGFSDVIIEDKKRALILDKICAKPWEGSPLENSVQLSKLLQEETLDYAQAPKNTLKNLSTQIEDITPQEVSLEALHRFTAFKTASPRLQKAFESVRYASPLSLLLTTAHILTHKKTLPPKRQVLDHTPLGPHKTLIDNDIFANDLTLTKACLAKGDFNEGVRALLVEKDHRPLWKYSDIRDIDIQKVMNVFPLESFN